ncbi:MAG TPA: hypothetical protein V6C72_10000 [Chroococcales cyanobacterium]
MQNPEIINAWIYGIALVGGAVLFSMLGLLLVRKRISRGTLKSHHEVAGYLLSIVGTLYSVLLGLIVVDTQTKYQQAKMMSRQEADCCLDMFHLAYAFPPQPRKALHQEIHAYLKTLVEEEWDSIATQSSFKETGATPFRNIWWTLCDYQPVTSREQISYDKYLDYMQRLADGRRYRLQVSKNGMSHVLWGVLLGGGVLTVLFTYMFEVEEVKSHMIMTALVSLALSLNVLLVALFSNPYQGYMRITSIPFKYDLRVIDDLVKLRPD